MRVSLESFNTTGPTLLTSLKFLMRCVASSLRSDDSITIYINTKDCIKKLAAILKYVNDQEILANTSKVRVSS